MKQSSARSLPLVALTAALALAMSLPAAAKPKHGKGQSAAPKTPKLMAPDEIKWTEVPEMTGISTATLWGDPAKGAHGSLHKFAAGKVTTLHTHSADSKLVVISGTLLTGLEGAAEKALPAGSFELMPAGVKHTTKCKAGADCVFVLIQNGAFDVKMDAAAAPAK